MFFNKAYIILFLCFPSSQVFGQLLNGSFEEWITRPSGDDVPLAWDFIPDGLEADTCTSRSNVASEGSYSLQLSSLNFVSGTLAPGYIATKFKPLFLQNRFKFQYLIDSISGLSHAVVGIYDHVEGNNWDTILFEKYNQISTTFIQESVDFTLPNLDTLYIGLRAENHELPVGYDGFIRVFFDNFVIENDFVPQFQIGTTWIYEVEEPPFPVKISYQTYEITRSTIFQNKDVFVIENDFDTSKEYMYVDGAMVYFWNSQLDSFQLNYNFSGNSMYTVPWEGVCAFDSGTAFVSIDSITFLLIDSDTIYIQNLSIENSGTIEGPWKKKVFVDIGPAEGGLQLPLGYGFCDFNRYLTKLRCFTSGSRSYKFVDYSCDSTWFSTSILNFGDAKPIIYPNPSTGNVWIEGPKQLYQFELYNSDGRLVQRGQIINNELVIFQKGVMVLRLFDDLHSFIYKVFIN